MKHKDVLPKIKKNKKLSINAQFQAPDVACYREDRMKITVYKAAVFSFVQAALSPDDVASQDH